MSGERTTLRLSSKAMEKLFPEDSEARLDLQRAVMHAAVEKVTVTSVDAETRKQMHEIVKDFLADMDVQSVVEESFKLTWGKQISGLEPDGPAQGLLRDQAERLVRWKLAEMVSEEAARAAERAVADFASKHGPDLSRKAKAYVEGRMREFLVDLTSEVLQKPEADGE